MGRKNIPLILLFTFFGLQVERIATCTWKTEIQIEGLCFILNTTELSYFDAKTECQMLGGELAKMKTKRQISIAFVYVPLSSYTWVGANDIAEEGTWLWEDRENATVLSTYWLEGEPRNTTSNEDCAQINKYLDLAISTYRLIAYAKDCNETKPFLCMEKAPSCRWTDSFTSDGECLLLNTTQLSYVDARSACELRGGALANIKSWNELDGVSLELGDAHGDSNVWIGASDAQTEGTWVMEDGGDQAENWNRLWLQGEPKNANGKEDCAQVYYQWSEKYTMYDFGLVAKECDDVKTFLCMEKDLPTTLAMTTTPDLTTAPAMTTTPAMTTAALTTTPDLTTAQGPAASTGTTIDRARTNFAVSTTTEENVANVMSYNLLLCFNLYAFNYLFI